MTDRLDAKIRAFVVELLGQPVEPPELRPVTDLTPKRQRPSLRTGWAVAVATLAAVLIVGTIALMPFQNTAKPPATAPEVVANMASALNQGDLEGTLGWFTADAECRAPGLPSCEDLFAFFVAADARLALSDCRVLIDPYLQCQGLIHTSIHDALGITLEDLQAMPNFPPAFIIENGQIVQMNFASPFTGDRTFDDRLWQFLADRGAEFVNDDGVPMFSAAIVGAFRDAAAQFAAESESN